MARARARCEVVGKGKVRGGWQGGPGWARARCEVVGKVGQGGVVSKGGVVGKVGRL